MKRLSPDDAKKSPDEQLCECGGPMTPALADTYDLSSYVGNLLKVRCEGLPIWRCGSCGETALSRDTIETALRTLAILLIKSDKLLPPPAAKALRRIIGLTQQDVAQRMSVARETVAGWERPGGKPISPQNDYILRNIALHELRERSAKRAGKKLVEDAFEAASGSTRQNEDFFNADNTAVIQLPLAG